jgi:hypothetical protein
LVPSELDSLTGAQQFARRGHPKDRRKHKQKRKSEEEEEAKKNTHTPLHTTTHKNTQYHIETTFYVVNFNDNSL